MKKKRDWRIILLEIVMVLISLIFLYPLFLTIINSLKSFSELMTDVIALPKKLAFENYAYVWKYINYPRLFLNNTVITVLGLAGIVLISSIAAYKLARTKSGQLPDLLPLHYANADPVPIDHVNGTANG